MLLDELACFSRLAKRSLAGVITTNYDTLIEKHLEDFNMKAAQNQILLSSTRKIMKTLIEGMLIWQRNY